ncbi:MAG: Mrp/NBP35 family ATP-binding protein [Euryarchaeota archaeon]|nr:Mrp/NBP35 family ATP-binding protein [Euryarchaeota archaeon]
MEDSDKIDVKTMDDNDYRLKKSLAKIKHKIVVMSGKGGVGKSTVSVNLATAMAMRGYDVGILDADITGPNIPKMLHIEDEAIMSGEDGLVPVMVPPHMKVVSMAFLLQSKDTPVIWRGPMKMQALRQFIADVTWGELDFLIVDLPPGTGDEPLSIAQMIDDSNGAVIVTTPQDVALLDSRKTVTFAQALKMPVMGIVENMSGLICPHCHKTIDLFKTGGGERAAEEMGVPFLGRIPLDPNVVLGGDDGMPIVLQDKTNPASLAFDGVVEKILAKVKEGR